MNQGINVPVFLLQGLFKLPSLLVLLLELQLYALGIGKLVFFSLGNLALDFVHLPRQSLYFLLLSIH